MIKNISILLSGQHQRFLYNNNNSPGFGPKKQIVFQIDSDHMPTYSVIHEETRRIADIQVLQNSWKCDYLFIII